ncbi:unnamed protein product [Eruca vesicaria subsp. sativa]|uniref:Uncharacterized protein n=1 Tax=Eruca vesicaria subsp. sativa TaxID=29727 RepID=A0ABC8KB50_ERUVS|nr:unnamed protein product [Eruca vesicaria subsp. sativa]
MTPYKELDSRLQSVFDLMTRDDLNVRQESASLYGVTADVRREFLHEDHKKKERLQPP